MCCLLKRQEVSASSPPSTHNRHVHEDISIEGRCVTARDCRVSLFRFANATHSAFKRHFKCAVKQKPVTGRRNMMYAPINVACGRNQLLGSHNTWSGPHVTNMCVWPTLQFQHTPQLDNDQTLFIITVLTFNIHAALK